MKKILLYGLLLAIPVMCLSQRNPRVSPDRVNDPNVQLQKFSQFYRYLTGSYIDTVDNVKVVENAIKDILSELDPHSSYISPEEMVGVSESFEGKFSGIGVQINTLNDTLHVAGVITGGPSEKVGLLPNDRIIAVDGTSIIGMVQTEAIKYLRGPKGSEVNIDVVRPGERDKLTFRIIRDDIRIETIDASYSPQAGTGYIRVNRFAQTTMNEFRDAYRELGNPESLIVDLRGNGGGLLGQSIEMANFFLPRGSLVVSTEGRVVPDEEYRAPRQPEMPEGRVVVLIDEYSASASEIVAGAMQDWDRAVIVGRRSFGKGLVQRQFPLIDGSAVNITVSRYLTPTGRAIQRPYEKGKGSDYYNDFYNRFNSADTLNTDEALRFTTLVLGKDVYEGEGIYPDYYIPADTSDYSDYLLGLVRKGVLFEYSNRYMDTHRNELLSQYSDVRQFMDRFTVTPQMMNELTTLGAEREVPLNEDELQISRGFIELRLKSYFARNLWGDTASYMVLNEDDPVMEKALEVLNNWTLEARGIATTECSNLTNKDINLTERV